MNKRIRNKKWKQKRDARRKYIKSIRGKVSRDTYAFALMAYAILYGFEIMMKREDVVSTFDYQEYILNNLNRFSDDDNIRAKAIERLGW